MEADLLHCSLMMVVWWWSASAINLGALENDDDDHAMPPLTKAWTDRFPLRLLVNPTDKSFYRYMLPPLLFCHLTKYNVPQKWLK